MTRINKRGLVVYSCLLAITVSTVNAAEPTEQPSALNSIASDFESSVILSTGYAEEPKEDPVSHAEEYNNALSGCCNNCCDTGCCDTGCCDTGCCGTSCLGGNGFRSDRCFDRFIEPITSSMYTHDPRSMTRIRFLFINQMIPERSLLGGGDLQVYAAQVNVAINERLSIVASKDGFISLQADGIPNQDGWANLQTGLQYVLIRDTCNQFLLSAGVIYNWSNGTSDVFQGNGDGNWEYYLSAGKELGRSHVVGTAGMNIPVDGKQASEFLFYSLHLDYMLTDKLYALVEGYGMTYTESGSRLAGATVEGGDLLNLGSTNVAGNTYASIAVGGTYKISKNVQVGVAHEVPVTGREDLLDNRTTATLSLIY